MKLFTSHVLVKYFFCSGIETSWDVTQSFYYFIHLYIYFLSSEIIGFLWVFQNLSPKFLILYFSPKLLCYSSVEVFCHQSLEELDMHLVELFDILFLSQELLISLSWYVFFQSWFQKQSSIQEFCIMPFFLHYQERYLLYFVLISDKIAQVSHRKESQVCF